ncbi:DUF7738 domain-containing protein [Chryseobacterium vrystaatense]|nr:hypothetical protein [Chryseobacterium vrystaatense]
MCRKINNLMLFIFILIQFISCKSTTDCPEEGFCIENKKLFYNQEPIALGMSIEKFVDIAGKYDRKVENSLEGHKTTYYYWLKHKLHVAISDSLIVVNNLEVDNVSGEYYGHTPSNQPEYPAYKSLEEIIKKYGKYDSIRIEEVPTNVRTFYVWDKLGISMAESNGVISTINLYPLHILKTMDLNLETGSTYFDGFQNAKVTQEILDTRKNDKAIFDRMPKQEFKGKFTYDGNTVDFGKIGNTDWDKVVSGLKISGSDFDPAGDSQNWSREIREGYDLYTTIDRYSNAQESGKLSAKKTGKIDAVGSISIWWHGKNDEK